MLKTSGTVTETYGNIQTNMTIAMTDIVPPARGPVAATPAPDSLTRRARPQSLEAGVAAVLAAAVADGGGGGGGGRRQGGGGGGARGGR